MLIRVVPIGGNAAEALGGMALGVSRRTSITLLLCWGVAASLLGLLTLRSHAGAGFRVRSHLSAPLTPYNYCFLHTLGLCRGDLLQNVSRLLPSVAAA